MQRLRPGEPPEITRGVYEKVRRYSRADFTVFCNNLYRDGFTDGRESAPGITYEKLYTTLVGVEGIRQTTIHKILAIIRAEFGGEKEGGDR